MSILLEKFPVSAPVRLLAAALLVVSAGSATAETVATNPVGFCRLAAMGSSDTMISVPFKRASAFVGRVASVAGNVITVQGTPAWTTSPQQFVYAAGTQPNTYYAFLSAGAREGAYFTITANGANTLTVDLAGADLAGVDGTTSIEIVPYWTLGTVFPAGAGVHASADETTRLSEVLVPDVTADGINASPAKTYYYSAGQWRQVGQGSAVKNDDCLLPDSFLTVRHRVATATVMNPAGDVVLSKLAVPLATSASGKQDNFVALTRPVPVSLNDSGLVSSGAFQASPNNLARTDELLVFDNMQAKTEKSASAVYFYAGGMWRKVGSGNVDVGATTVFSPGVGVVIRKNTNPAATTATWTNSPTYTN